MDPALMSQIQTMGRAKQPDPAHLALFSEIAERHNIQAPDPAHMALLSEIVGTHNVKNPDAAHVSRQKDEARGQRCRPGCSRTC